MWVRYPAFDLAFAVDEGGKEIPPGGLPSFRLGLAGDRFPGISYVGATATQGPYCITGLPPNDVFGDKLPQGQTIKVYTDLDSCNTL